MSLGLSECAVSVVRIVFLFQIGEDITCKSVVLVSHGWTPNLFQLVGDLTKGAIWGSIEPSVGVICACLPTMLPFLESYLYKPIRNAAASLQSLLRQSRRSRSDYSKGRSSIHGQNLNSSSFQRLHEPSGSLWTGSAGVNTTVAMAAGKNPDVMRDTVLLENISVRKDVDVERAKEAVTL